MSTGSVESRSDLPECDDESEGLVYFVEDESTYVQCRSGDYSEVTVDLPDDPTDPSPGSGGLIPGSVGGNAGSGGTATGGDSGSGGETASGGNATGGDIGSGGDTATGGNAAGGESAAGGDAGTGGHSGSGGAPGEPYNPTEDGYFRWLGVLPERPSDPTLGDALYWEQEEALCVWDGTSWILLFSEEPTADCKAWEEVVETTPLPAGTRDASFLSTALDGFGNAFIAWTGQSEETPGARSGFVIRKQLGEEFTEPLTLGENGADSTELIADGQGHALVAYLDLTSWPLTRHTVEFSSGSFGPPQQLEGVGAASGTLKPIYTRDGEVFAAWTTSSPNAEIALSRRSIDGVWSAPVSLGAGVDGGYPFNPSIAVGPNGELCVFWVNTLVGGWDIYSSTYDPQSGWQVPVKIYEAEGVVRYQQGKYDDDGNLLVVFSDEIGNTQPVFSTFRPAGGSFPTPEIVSLPSEESWEIDLEITGQQEWIVVWEAKNGVSATTTTDGTNFGALQEWKGPFENPTLVPLGQADALVVFGQVRDVVSARYSEASGWLPRQTLGATRGFDTFSAAANDKGDALVAWETVDGFSVLFYR